MSYGIHLSRCSVLKKDEERTIRVGSYAREVFRATLLDYFKNQLVNDPMDTIIKMIGNLHKIGTIMAHLADQEAKREGKLHIPEIDVKMLFSTVMERDKALCQAAKKGLN